MALDNTKTDLATEIHAFLKKIGLAYELERIRDNRVSFSGAGVPTEEELKAFLAENLQVLRPSSTESQASSGAEIQINPSTEISAVFNEVLEPMKETDKSALSEDDDFVIVDPNFVQEEAELPRSNEPIYMEEIEELEFPENTSVVAIPIRDEDRAKSAVAGVSSTAFYTSYEDFSKTHDRSGILAQVADRKAIQRKDAITKTLKLSETDAEKSGKYTFNL